MTTIAANRASPGGLAIGGNAALTTITGFRSLTRIRGTLQIYESPNLRSFPGFANLRTVGRTVCFNRNNANFDWSGLRNLRCHGGPYRGAAVCCQGCPAWFLNLPTC